MKSIARDDILNYTFLSHITYNPTGTCAAFVAARADRDENSYVSYVHLYADGEVKRMTGLGKEKQFWWLNEHALLFPAVRSAAEKKRAETGDPFTAFYCLDIGGGEAQPYFTVPFAVADMKVLDTSHFVVTAMLDANDPEAYLLEGEARQAALKKRKEDRDYEVLDESPFWFNGAGFVNKQRRALFLVTLENGTPQFRRVTEPLENAGILDQYGDEVLFSSETFENRMPIYGFCIKAVNWKTGAVRDVVRNSTHSLEGLHVADGIIYLRANDGKRHGLNENAWVYTLDADTGKMTLLREEAYSMYGSVGSDCRLGESPACAVRGRDLYHITTREGDAVLYRILPDGTSESVIQKSGSIDGFALSPADSSILLIAMYDMKLQEVYAWQDGKLQQVSHLNEKALADAYVAQPEYREITSAGQIIGGWVLKPKDYDPEKTYPAVLDIHGGPKTVYGHVFYHEMQYWAGKGYFVFFCNPKGSDGRDSAFMDIRGDYGYTDYRNIMDFTNAVLAAYPQIDPKRVCETGGSYGGFMTNWIIGHTDRFCCAASQRSISNWLSFWGVSDIGSYFAEDQTLGNPFVRPEKMWEHSPLKYAENVKTPTLFIHSDEDYRCPLEQGLQMYTALVQHGVPARLCLFHGENHELSRSGKPLHRLRRLQEITDWFDRYSAK